jgi:hypothetical protein
MVKILSLIIFIAAFILSWCAFNSKSNLGIDIHAGIQSKLTLLIEDTIKAKRPSSENFKLIKMYTQKIDDLKVLAHFAYEFQDQMPATESNSLVEKVAQKIAGTAILAKSISEDPSVQKWVIQSIKTGTETVDFNDGLTITSDGKTSEENPTEAAPAPEHKAPSENK